MGDVNERDIRKRVSRYRMLRFINMARAAVLIVVGIFLFYGTITDRFPSDGAAIGKSGVMAVGLTVSTVILLMGIIWFLRIRRHRRVDVKAFEQALRSGVRIE